MYTIHTFMSALYIVYKPPINDNKLKDCFCFIYTHHIFCSKIHQINLSDTEIRAQR